MGTSVLVGQYDSPFVRRTGVVTKKALSSFLMAINIISPDHSRDRAYLSNYILSQVRDRLTRIDGVADVVMFGGRDYAMRVWIDPDRAAARSRTGPRPRTCSNASLRRCAFPAPLPNWSFNPRKEGVPTPSG